MDELKIIANEMLPVYENELGEQIVIARELHSGLMVGRDFTTWIKNRIDQYDFVEDDDYFLTLTKSGERQNVVRHEYYLTLDCAKEIAMVENNEMGRSIRKYFIQVERQFRKQQQRSPKSQAEMLLASVQQLVEQERKVKQLEEKITTVNHRLDNIDKIDTLGDLQQRLNAMIRRFANQEGVTYSKAWDEFRNAYNTAYRTNLKAKMKNYQEKHVLTKLTKPQYFSLTGQLEDAIRVADKLLNTKVAN